MVAEPPYNSGNGREYAKQLERWKAKWAPILPVGWLEAGGPIRTDRKPPVNRHVPGRAHGGGYDLAAVEAREEPGGQLALW